jgi:ABC-2 type transport system permease protein
MGLAIALLAPAFLQLGIVALSKQRVDLIKPHEYFALTQIIFALFCAAVAPELLGRDARAQTLALYFSRALRRSDYATAKLAALVTGMFAVAVVPPIVGLVGLALGDNDSLGYLWDHLDLIPAILASSLLLALFMSSISLAVASQSSRRSIATGAVLGVFVLTSVLVGTLIATASGDLERYLVFLHPFDVMQGTIYWLFGEAPPADSEVATAAMPGYTYLLVVLGATAVASLYYYRRYERLHV